MTNGELGAANMLTETIPESICSLPNLKNFSFAYNFFTAEPPTCLDLDNFDESRLLRVEGRNRDPHCSVKVLSRKRQYSAIKCHHSGRPLPPPQPIYPPPQLPPSPPSKSSPPPSLAPPHGPHPSPPASPLSPSPALPPPPSPPSPSLSPPLPPTSSLPPPPDITFTTASITVAIPFFITVATFVTTISATFTATSMISAATLHTLTTTATLTKSLL